MKYLKQFGIILTISFIGEILYRVIPLPIPAGIYGIIAMSISVGSFITTPVWGIVYDTTGSYRPGFLVMPVLIALAFLLQILSIRLQEKAKTM